MDTRVAATVTTVKKEDCTSHVGIAVIGSSYAAMNAETDVLTVLPVQSNAQTVALTASVTSYAVKSAFNAKNHVGGNATTTNVQRSVVSRATDLLVMSRVQSAFSVGIPASDCVGSHVQNSAESATRMK